MSVDERRLYQLPKGLYSQRKSLCITMHNILIVPFTPLPRAVTRISRKPTHTNRHINLVPSRDVLPALPIITTRRGSRVRKPVQHNRVEHFVFAEHLLYIPIMMRPVSVLFVRPGGQPNWRVSEAVADGLRFCGHF